MKVAGGDVLAVGKPSVKSVITEDDTGRVLRQLMPGYVLIERRDLMIDAMQQGDDAIDALLGYLTVHHHCEQLEDQSVIWHSQRKTSGWIVPIATGFQGISPLGEAKISEIHQCRIALPKVWSHWVNLSWRTKLKTSMTPFGNTAPI